MKKLFILTLCTVTILHTQALQISEVMSNPIGDDGGREWIEIFNNSSSTVDVSTLTISIKGGTAVVTTPVSGGTSLLPNEYAIIGSTVSSATKFSLDYPAYTGVLFKSSISLVNTGITSIDIKINGSTVDSLSSYTAAKEGSSLSFASGSFITSTPTPGGSNQGATQDAGGNSSGIQAPSTTTETQAVIAQTAPPNADILLYVPIQKTVVAGAETTFTVGGMTRAGTPIDKLVYTWAFGDGGVGTGSSTKYSYAYPGKYIAQVEGSNGYVAGTGKIVIHVISPDISILGIQRGKYGTYVDISNPNSYDLDFSQWQLSIDGSRFSFPKNTVLAGNSITHISGLAMGFASTTISQFTTVKVLFPNQEEVAQYGMHQNTDVASEIIGATSSPQVHVVATSTVVTPPINRNKKIAHIQSKTGGQVLGTTTKIKSNISSSSGTLVYKEKNKDTRLISFFKTLFNK